MDEIEIKRAKGTGAKFAYETIRDEILSLTLAPERAAGRNLAGRPLCHVALSGA